MSKRIRVKFLGCGDAFSSGGRLQACISVEWQGKRLLLDCGATSLAALEQGGVGVDEVDGILISHLHGDHFGGLPFFILKCHVIAKRTKPLVIAGPPGLDERLHAAREALYAGSTDLPRDFEIELIELEERVPREILGAQVEPFRVPHGGGAPAYGYRMALGDRVLAYSGDTEWTDDLIELSRGTELFICECYFLEEARPNHIDYPKLRANKDRLACKRTILVHLSEEMLAHEDRVEFEYASPGQTIEI